MDEELLVDLMGDIDVSLLKDTIEFDLSFDKGFVLSSFYYEKAKGELGTKFEIKIEAMKKKVNYIYGIISGIAAAVLLTVGIVTVLLRKKSAKFAVL